MDVERQILIDRAFERFCTDGRVLNCRRSAAQQFLESDLTVLVGDVQFVSRESARKPRLEDVTTTALPKVEDHLATLRVELGGSCLTLTSETVGLPTGREPASRENDVDAELPFAWRAVAGAMNAQS